MKKSLITFSTFALFVGAVFADDSAHKTISEGTFTNSIYASESDVASGGSSLTIDGGTFNLSSSVNNPDLGLFGGGKEGSSIKGNTLLQFNDGLVNGGSFWHFGGSDRNSQISGDSTAVVNGGKMAGYDNDRAAVFGGSAAGSTVHGNSSVTIRGDLSGTSAYGAGAGARQLTSGSNGTLSAFVDLADKSVVKGNSTVTIAKGATVYTVSGGGLGNSEIGGNLSLNINGTVRSWVNAVGGKYSVVKGTSEVKIGGNATINGLVTSTGEVHGNNVNYAADGSVESIIDRSKNVMKLTIEGGAKTSEVFAIGQYGESSDFSAKAYGSVSVEIKDGAQIGGNVRAAGLMAHIYGDTHITVSGETTVLGRHLYVGSDRGTVIEGNSYATVSDATITKDIYGGSYGSSLYGVKGEIKGSSFITLKDVTVKGTVYAGGKGSLSSIGGESVITAIGTKLDVANISGKGALDGDGYGEVKGDSVLAFGNVSDAFVGTISANITDFDKMEISNSATNVVFEKAFDVPVLQVAADAKATLTEGTSFEKLILAFDSDFSQGSEDSVDFETIFGSSTSIVLSSLQDEAGASLTVKDSSGQEWSLASKDFSDNTLSFVVGSQVPEPATYAAIFGTLALAFAAYRRRK